MSKFYKRKEWVLTKYPFEPIGNTGVWIAHTHTNKGTIFYYIKSSINPKIRRIRKSTYKRYYAQLLTLNHTRV